MWKPTRQMQEQAFELLDRVAAAWGVDPAELIVSDGTRNPDMVAARAMYVSIVRKDLGSTIRVAKVLGWNGSTTRNYWVRLAEAEAHPRWAAALAQVEAMVPA